ncbi:MAG: hypothetical protein ABIX01_05810 [Chitinophagaceae bacterium]
MAVLKKERIKDRMQKTAARLWGIPDNEIDTNFDPLVMLLIEACAAEMEKIGYAINNSHERLLEKLAELIVPEAVVGAKPASAIAVATPTDTTATLTNQTGFSLPQNILNYTTNTQYTHQFYFTPIGDFSVLKAQLASLVIGQKFYKVAGNNRKELVHNEAPNGQVKINELWMGIVPDKNLTNLKSLSICFDLRSHSLAPAFYASLGYVTAFVGDAELLLAPGYFNQVQFDLNPEEMLVTGHDYANKINRQSSEVYKQQFLHIAKDLTPAVTGMPAELESKLPKLVAAKFAAEPMVFVKIHLNRFFTQDDLDGLSVSINAVPVVNRKLHTLHYRTDTWVNIVPLQVEGNFLDIHSIESSGGAKYKFRASAEQQNLEDGEALIRSSGVGKSNSKEVRDIITNLMDAIRDESAYFSETSNDFISSRLKEISMILSRLDDQMQKSKDLKDAKHYLLLKPKTAGETIAIRYWTTDGALANQINPGAILLPHNQTQIGNKDAYLVTNANGGRDRTLENEKRALLKQQIISKGKIISAFDIKMLCHQIFGKNLIRATVEKSVAIGNAATDGFSRVIQVRLELEDKEAANVSYLCRELQSTLSNEATIVYPFQVLVV